MKTCFYFTSDLMFSSRVKPIAIENGFELKYPGLEPTQFVPPPDLVIFDLEFVTEKDLGEIMSVIAGLEPTKPKTVAYGPHVKESKLEAARDAGVELVWTRGQFNHGFPKLFST